MDSAIINLLGMTCCGFVLANWAYDTFNIGALKIERVEVTNQDDSKVENVKQQSEYELLL